MSNDKEFVEKRKKHGAKCKGKFDFCWPWYEFSNGDMGVSNKKPKGLGILKYTNIETHKKSRNTSILVYGNNKSDTVALNYCPFCGADYRNLGRLSYE